MLIMCLLDANWLLIRCYRETRGQNVFLFPSASTPPHSVSHDSIVSSNHVARHGHTHTPQVLDTPSRLGLQIHCLTLPWLPPPPPLPSTHHCVRHPPPSPPPPLCSTTSPGLVAAPPSPDATGTLLHPHASITSTRSAAPPSPGVTGTLLHPHTSITSTCSAAPPGHAWG